MLIELAYLMIGCGLLFYGGDWLVDGIARIAVHASIPPVIVACVIMGFGTSAPELFVAMNAMAMSSPEIAMGNIVGSNVANLLLVLALSALIAPLAIDRAVLRIDGSAMLFSAIAFVVATLDGVVSRVDAIILVFCMLTYLTLRWRSLPEADTSEAAAESDLWRAVLLCGAALVALPLGSYLFIEAAIGIAGRFGISEALIGLTVVAVGTSLPELAACIAAAIRRQSNMILGGILGSNVFNSTIVLGGAAAVAPVAIAGEFFAFWIPVMIGASLITLAFLRTNFLLSRREASIMLLGYAAIFAV